MNKKGQFFLLAAVVILTIFYGLTMIYTKAEIPFEDESVFDLTKEIKFESSVVVDSGIFFAKNDEEIKSNIENLTDYYGATNPGSDLMFLFGNRSNMTAIFYTTQNTGSIGVQAGASGTSHQVTQERKFTTTFLIPQEDDEVTVVLDKETVNEIRYTFKVKPGEMFFIILKKVRQGEQFVSASKEQ